MGLLQVDYAGCFRCMAAIVGDHIREHISRVRACEEVTDDLPAIVRACLNQSALGERLANGSGQL